MSPPSDTVPHHQLAREREVVQDRQNMAVAGEFVFDPDPHTENLPRREPIIAANATDVPNSSMPTAADLSAVAQVAITGSRRPEHHAAAQHSSRSAVTQVLPKRRQRTEPQHNTRIVVAALMIAAAVGIVLTTGPRPSDKTRKTETARVTKPAQVSRVQIPQPELTTSVTANPVIGMLGAPPSPMPSPGQLEVDPVLSEAPRHDQEQTRKRQKTRRRSTETAAPVAPTTPEAPAPVEAQVIPTASGQFRVPSAVVSKVKQCGKDHGAIPGDRVLTRVLIGSKGEVRNAKASGRRLSKDLASCVEQAVSTTTFGPEHQGVKKHYFTL